MVGRPVTGAGEQKEKYVAIGHRRVWAMAAMLTVSTVAVGCGKAADKASEKIAEKAIEQSAGDGVDVDINADDGTYSVNTPDGSYQAGTSVPDTWPDDIPLPKDLNVSSGMNATDAGTQVVTVSGSTGDDLNELKALYKSALSGWTEGYSSESVTDGTKYMQLMLQDGDRSLTVIGSEGESGSDLTLSYSVSPQEP